MTLTLERPAVELDAGNGGVPARRAVVRWAWRLLFREWRQQLLILCLVVVAVAATVVGAGVAVNTPTPSQAGFGAANARIQLPAGDPQVASTTASLHQHGVGTIETVDDQTVSIPGSINTFQLRSQDPTGPYGGAMLSVVSGRYPRTGGEIAVTPGVASDFQLHVGSTWHEVGHTFSVVGIVQDPLNTLEEFALVLPGSVPASGQLTLLFHLTDAQLNAIGSTNLYVLVQQPPNLLNGGFNPKIFVILIATLGMVLIGLVSVGGFTVLAQRRLRSIGMMGALGATDKNIRLVVRANGLAVGVVGTAVGFVVGLVAWLLYRPHVEAASHHILGVFALPWVVILPAMALAVLTTWLAASRPGRAMAHVPVVAALSGRPPQPQRVHRSAVPGVVFAVAAYFLIFFAGVTKGNGGGAIELVLGFVALAVAVILLAPLAITSSALLARRAPVSVRMAMRDLVRYRARSGSALGAISLSVVVAATVCVVAAARYGNPLDYAGANLANNQLVVYAALPPPPGGDTIQPGPNGGEIVKANNPANAPAAAAPLPSMASQQAEVGSIATSLGSHKVVELDQVDANLVNAGRGRQFNGQIFVGTPQLLRAFGIAPSQVDPTADVLTMRPGLSSVSTLQLQYGAGSQGFGGPAGSDTSNCPPGSCVAHPNIQELSSLPSGTSAPNTVITEHAVSKYHLQTSIAAWMVITNHPITTVQVDNARHGVSTMSMSVESKSDAPSSAQVIDWATVAGMLLVLAILGMTVGLIRSEAASDLRTLTATGASGRTRRTLTAVTAGTLTLIGAVVGIAGAYLAAFAFFASAPNGDGVSELGNIPIVNLGVLLIAMPLVGAAGGWLLAGRQPAYINQQPLE